jgi:tetratricopeptide (TPR) repeat protein
MKKTLIFLCVLTLTQSIVQGQAFKEQFWELVDKKDSLGQIGLLQKWEATNEKDPELYVAYYNMYVQQSREEFVVLGTEPSSGPQLTVLDSTGKNPVGYMYSEVKYNPDILQKAFDYIDKGIEINPNRLDLRFGKVYMLCETKDYENFTKELIKVIDYSSTINNEWLWEDNKPVESPMNFMLGNVQSYVYQLFETEDDSLLDNMSRISERVLKYYPDNVESLSNMSVVNLIQKNYEKALEYLLKAYDINPKDPIILGNIAEAYKRQGDNENAIKFYKESLKYGDKESNQYTKEQIRLLEKK